MRYFLIRFGLCLGAASIGFLTSLPGFYVLGFGIPGSCTSLYCGFWYLMLACLASYALIFPVSLFLPQRFLSTSLISMITLPSLPSLWAIYIIS